MRKLTVMQLVAELLGSGWKLRRRAVVLAARYYLGIDSREVLAAYLTAAEVAEIDRMR